MLKNHSHRNGLACHNWRFSSSRFLMATLLTASLTVLPSVVDGQDSMFRIQPRSQRGVYQPPTILDVKAGIQLKPERPQTTGNPSIPAPPMDADAQQQPAPVVVQVAHMALPQEDSSVLAEPGQLMEPPPAHLIEGNQGEVIYEDHIQAPTSLPQYYDNSCDAMPYDLGCDSPGDWLLGPTLLGGCCSTPNCGGCGGCSNGFIPVPDLRSRCWFGSVEWLSYERRGQDLPVLAERTNVTPNTSLFGGSGRLGEDQESGVQFMLGRWLDPYQTQSLQGRYWGMSDETFGFSADSTVGFPVAIPFTSLGVGAATFPVISDPSDILESLDIGFESKLLGGDIVFRHLASRGLGGRVDFFYGYQYLRLDEDLIINATNVRQVIPNVDSTVATLDQFGVRNDFHAAKFGFDLRYDEGPWVFDSRFAFGLGGMKRRAVLAGRTTITEIANPVNTSTVASGLLVRDSNAGDDSTSSFAISPEVNVGLGYRLNPNMNFRVGYTFLMVTDALQAYRTIDTTVDETIAATRPVRDFTYGDYWVQGLHLGVTFNY